MNTRKAKVEDMKQVRDLVSFYAGKNLMLARSLSYLYENLRDFTVAIDGDLIVGCCSLHISWDDLAEVKSLAVDPRYVDKGVGKKLLDKCLSEAKHLGIPNVFTLTLEPQFFKKQGFKTISKEKLPMKIWGECKNCSKYPDCDEESLMIRVK